MNEKPVGLMDSGTTLRRLLEPARNERPGDGVVGFGLGVLLRKQEIITKRPL